MYENTIFLGLAGSQAHGTARKGSDLDLRGVCVAPLRVRLSLFEQFEQHEGELSNELKTAVAPQLDRYASDAAKVECVIFDVAKFIRLCAAANPNALEILFTDPGDWLLKTRAWERLYAHRHLFLTAKVQQTFLGYAMAQLRKIKTHRTWLLHPPKRKPTRQEFGLPDAGTLGRDDQCRIEAALSQKLRDYGIADLELPKSARIALQERLTAFWCDMLNTSEDELEDRLQAVATRELSLPTDVVATLNAEKRYRAAMKHWAAYESWQTERNPKRAELERRHGYDTKHAMHLIRLMRMGLEALQTGELHVRRADAQELGAIRDGAYAYDELLAEADRLQQQMNAAAATTTLPADVDSGPVDALAFALMTEDV